MLFFYLPMIIIGAMFGNNSNGRSPRVTHTEDVQ